METIPVIVIRLSTGVALRIKNTRCSLTLQLSLRSFAEHPVFHQLNRRDNRKKGGIKTDVQRSNFTLLYDYNEDDYVKILEANGFAPLIRFFLHDRLSYQVPLRYMRDAYLYSSTDRCRKI